MIEGAVEQVIEHLRTYNGIDIFQFNSLIADGITYYSANFKIGEITSGQDFYVSFYNQLNKFPPSPVWMYVYKRQFLQKGQLFFKEGILHEDEHFTPRAFFLASKAVGIFKPILFHRIKREGAITFNIEKKT